MRTILAAIALSLAVPALAQEPTYPPIAASPFAYVDHMQLCAEIIRGREIRAAHPTAEHWKEPPCRDIPAGYIDSVYKMVGYLPPR